MGKYRNFFSWKSAFESEGLKVNMARTMALVSKIHRPSSKTDPCGICIRKTMVSVVSCNLVETRNMEVVERLKG